MRENLITAVITLVSKNKKYYLLHFKLIINILQKYDITKYRTDKLSDFVKDFYFKVDKNKLLDIKIYLKKKFTVGSDICVQETIFRKKKIIACDMDKTIVSSESIDLIGKKYQKSSKISKLTKDAMSGKINFNNSIIQRTKFLKGMSINEIEEVAQHIKTTKYADSVIKTLNKFGCHTMLISGGYEILANLIGKKIGFKEIISNKLIIKDNVLTGNLKGTIINGKGKLNHLKKRLKFYKFNKQQTLAVGDGHNDIEMIRFASLGVSWKGYPEVNAAADALANNNFKSILYFQGYSDDEIIS